MVEKKELLFLEAKIKPPPSRGITPKHRAIKDADFIVFWTR
jgi:hypothetical protein